MATKGVATTSEAAVSTALAGDAVAKAVKAAVSATVSSNDRPADQPKKAVASDLSGATTAVTLAVALQADASKVLNDAKVKTAAMPMVTLASGTVVPQAVAEAMAKSGIASAAAAVSGVTTASSAPSKKAGPDAAASAPIAGATTGPSKASTPGVGDSTSSHTKPSRGSQAAPSAAAQPADGTSTAPLRSVPAPPAAPAAGQATPTKPTKAATGTTPTARDQQAPSRQQVDVSPRRAVQLETEKHISDSLDKFFSNDKTWREVATTVAKSKHFLDFAERLKGYRRQAGTFRVVVPKPYPGVQYRKAKSLDERHHLFAENMKVVSGVIEDGEWLRIIPSTSGEDAELAELVKNGGRIFLPVRVGAMPILEPLSQASGGSDGGKSWLHCCHMEARDADPPFVEASSHDGPFSP